MLESVLQARRTHNNTGILAFLGSQFMCHGTIHMYAALLLFRSNRNRAVSYKHANGKKQLDQRISQDVSHYHKSK